MKTKTVPPTPPPPAGPDPNGGFCGPQTARRHNRPPTWRWDYACTLARCNKQPLGDDDAWVQKAFDFRRHQLGVPGAPKPASGLLAAYSLYTTTEAFQRWVVEARFVADESAREVAAATGINQATLKAYEKIFFDLAGPKGDRPAVRANVIMPLVVRDTGPDDRERALKLFAFKYGLAAMNKLVDYYTTAPPAVRFDAEGVDAETLEDWLWRLEVRFAVHADALPPAQIAGVYPLQALIERIKSRLAEMGRLGTPERPSGAPTGR